MKKIVTIGGGTGSFGLLSELKKRKLKNNDLEISAIIAMSDSGGSSGVLMDAYGVLPAGDLRQALVALSKKTEVLRKLFSYRYQDGFLKGHSFGNLFISTVEKMEGSLKEAIKTSEEVLDTLGKIYPITFDKHELIAEMDNGDKIISEKNLDNADLSNLKKIYLSKKVTINNDIKKIIREADIIIVSPGSFYTSIIPNFLVEELVLELKKSQAQKIFITNIVTEKQQTTNFSVLDFLINLEQQAGFSDFDYVFYNTNNIVSNQALWDKYLKEEKFFVKQDKDLKYKKVKFIGSDFLLKPKKKYRKHLIRTNFKKIVDNIFNILDKKKLNYNNEKNN